MMEIVTSQLVSAARKLIYHINLKKKKKIQYNLKLPTEPSHQRSVHFTWQESQTAEVVPDWLLEVM